MPVPVLETPPGPITRIDGREYLYFVGTGYLGLQGHPEVIRAACEAAQQYGIGSANSRTVFGTTKPVVQVERAAAAMFGLDDAFYFASGWMGNNILVQSLDAADRLVLIDECSHYSLFEAARTSAWPIESFHHRDTDDLRVTLKKCLKPGQSPVVLSDGVFAATGNIAPVEDYFQVLQNYRGSVLCLDDAHGLAVLGENGRGTYEHAGLWHDGVNAVAVGQAVPDIIPCEQVDTEHVRHSLTYDPTPPCPALLFCGTLSKAVGGFGGIIPGGREFIDRLKSRSPYFAGASAPPAPIAAASARAIELVMADPGRRTRLWSNVRLLKDGLRRMGFDVDDTPVPIVCLTIGTADTMQRIQRELFERGIALAYMATYSGLGPEGGLRLAVFASHTEEMIGRLLDELKRLV